MNYLSSMRPLQRASLRIYNVAFVCTRNIYPLVLHVELRIRYYVFNRRPGFAIWIAPTNGCCPARAIYSHAKIYLNGTQRYTRPKRAKCVASTSRGYL